MLTKSSFVLVSIQLRGLAIIRDRYGLRAPPSNSITWGVISERGRPHACFCHQSNGESGSNSNAISTCERRGGGVWKGATRALQWAWGSLLSRASPIVHWLWNLLRRRVRYMDHVHRARLYVLHPMLHSLGKAAQAALRLCQPGLHFHGEATEVANHRVNQIKPALVHDGGQSRQFYSLAWVRHSSPNRTGLVRQGGARSPTMMIAGKVG